MLRKTIDSYREAMRFWVPLLSVHLFVRIIVSAILIPIIAFLLSATLAFSDQSALTDQDIARFLLTPAGLFGAAIILSLLIVSAVIDVAVMAAVLRSPASGILKSLEIAFGFLVAALPRLISFSGRLLIRVLLVAAPFAVTAGLVAFFLLRDFDINYYLAFRPPAFLWAVSLGGICAAAFLILLLERMTAWAIALHLSVFDLEPTECVFALSREKMQGHRLQLFGRVLLWLGLRVVSASLLVTMIGFLLAETPQLFDQSMKAFFSATAIVLIIWAIANTFLSAISNGALSDILNDELDRSLQARPARLTSEMVRAQPNRKIAILVVAALSLGSFVVGGVISNEIGGLKPVEIIGHRGASESRPENTMAAILKAVEDGADWVEIDVQETADGEVLVVHDSDFMKAAGVPTKVWNITIPEVAEIDIGSWFDPGYSDERAPLLRDVLEMVRGRSKLIIELKYYGHDVDLEQRVVALVEEARMQDQIATMSLKYPAVRKMIALRPDWRAGVLAATSVGDLSGLEGDFLAVSSNSVSQRLLSRAASAEKQVYVWTVNDAATMSRMISLGVDGLITDRPKLAGDVIAYYETLSTPERVMLRLGDIVGFAFDLTIAEEGDP